MSQGFLLASLALLIMANKAKVLHPCLTVAVACVCIVAAPALTVFLIFYKFLQKKHGAVLLVALFMLSNCVPTVDGIIPFKGC